MKKHQTTQSSPKQQSSKPAPQKTAPAEVLLQAVNLHQAGNLHEAETIYKTLLTSYPNDAMILNLLGTVYAQRGSWEEGIRLMETAIAANPEYANAHYDRGFALLNIGRYHEALASFEKTIALAPNDAFARYNKGLIKLLLGEYEEGWPLYEWHWKSVGQKDARTFQKPLWLGKEPLAGKTILLHAEQGLGDAIQLCRYVPHIEALGGAVILGVPASLRGVMSTLKGSFHIVTEEDPLPEFDLHCPLFSLPLALGTRIETIPTNIPYLYAPPQKRTAWQQRLGKKEKPRVGLAWSGGTTHKNDRNRSIALSSLTPLLQLDYDFHSLQKEIRSSDAATFAQQNRIISHVEALNDFADTATLISEMDLVISVDTSVAHLAGALGMPLCILLPFAPDFRWLLERENSPWYPTARLFRQPRIGDWESVITKITTELAALNV